MLCYKCVEGRETSQELTVGIFGESSIREEDEGDSDNQLIACETLYCMDV